MPKYIIDIPEDRVTSDGKLRFMACIDSPLANWIYTGIFAEPFDRKAIEDEVWDLVRIITDMTDVQRKECFGGETCNLDEYLTYQEAKEKYEAWRKQKNEIRVGDEVVYADDPNKEKAIVLRLYQPKQYKTLADILCEDGTVIKMIKVENLAWTGRHFDEVEELLKKMKEGDRP